MGATALRVASFNLRTARAVRDGLRWWPFRRHTTAVALRDLDADVVAVQEAYACQLRYVRRHAPGLVEVGRGRERRGGGEHASLLVSTARVAVLEERTRWFGPTPDESGSRLPGAHFPRTATIAWLEVDGRARVQVVATHLDAASAELRRASVEQLVGWLDPTVPCAVLGDLNAGPDSRDLRPLLDAGFRHALPAEAGGTFHRWTGATDGSRIDHVLVRGDVEVASAEVVHTRPGGRLPSDHWPVVADLRLPDAR